MHFEPIRRTASTLTVRLTTWNTLVVILVGVAAFIAAREGLRYTLIRETDVVLGDEAAELVLGVQDLYPELKRISNVLERKAETHADHDWFVQLVDRDGAAVWTSPNFPAELESLGVPSSTRLRIDERDGFRVATQGVLIDGRPLYWVRVGTSTAFIKADVTRITQLMIPAGIVIMLLSPLGGYWLARQAVAPLRRIIDTTRGLRPSKFDDRLPIRGTGDELDRLSGEINHFLDQIADHLDRQHDFLANAAHELRSPLAAIQTTLDVALSRERSAEEYEEMLPPVIDECRRLAILVNQLLLLAENDAGATAAVRESFAMDQAVSRAVEMFQGVAAERSIKLAAEVERGVTVCGHGVHLRQVVANLIDNAVKFTPAGGTVHVTLNCDRERGRVVFRVQDAGVGISESDLPRIFDRFYRGDKAHQHTEGKYGSGLGLSICQAIVAAHGGQIEVESKVGEGTCLTVTLPAETSAGSARAVEAPSPEGSERSPNLREATSARAAQADTLKTN
jgi:heavy metal sensor kinase